MAAQKKPIEYVMVFVIASVIGLVGGLYLANFVFVTWQKLPSEIIGFGTIFTYKAAYGHIPAVKKAIQTCLMIVPLTAAALDIFLAFALFSKPRRELHGSARFANEMELRKTGFLPTPVQEKKLKDKFPSEPPIIIGKHKDKFLQFFGNEFVSIGAPTRSGKGVSIVIPNLLTYPDSIVVLDIKMENWDLTAGFRAKYQKVFRFSPSALDGRSHRYNPLDYIRRDELYRMSDIQNIANIFFPANTGNDTSDFFNGQAQRLFTGLVLYMLETPERPCTLSELVKLAEAPKPLNEWITETIDKRKKEGRELSVECIQALMAYAGNPAENTRGGIDATLKTPLIIFSDPMVACATSCSDFRLDEVRKEKQTIYIGIQPNELAKFSKLINVMISQFIDQNMVLPELDKSYKYQCLLLLDEFTSLGCVEIIQKSIAYIAGYNMRLMPIFQSKSQVEDAYGRDGARAIFSNIACQIEFTPTEQEQADEISKMLGTETVKGKSVSRNRGKGGGGSVSTSDQSRALMLPQELKEMKDDEQLIFFRRTKPIKCKKAFYYTNPAVFGSRMKKLDRPAEGLPIPAKHQPPKLDVLEMLKVMRGIEKDPVTHHSKLQSSEHYEKNHPEFLPNLGDSLGFDEDFLAKLDKMENSALEKMYKQENGLELVEPNDEDDGDIVFDLSNTDEFDADFVEEINF
ncbi:type IV secretory system conjugative DNA transfer family protein (plasmid) [Moraxella atlantae]|uniref:type IV secretory system conjugative DNA transfer family protein n=1 Tax=Faucicola atlantae TaxID=34059 RepID=UPI00375197A1